MTFRPRASNCYMQCSNMNAWAGGTLRHSNAYYMGSLLSLPGTT